MRRESEALARALRSLHLDAARIEVKYSDERLPREAILALIDQCHIYIGLYNKTHYRSTDPHAGISLAEQEFNEAQRLEKPQLIFVKQLSSAERASPQQFTFVERVMNLGDKNIRTFEFNDLVQLEDQVADALMTLVPERFALQVTRPIFQAPNYLETFVGRKLQLEKLINALSAGRTVLIHGLDDVGGLGKSELAIYAAHHLRDRFPDGVLWADVQTARPGDLLISWARAFGGFPSLDRGDLRFEFRGLSAEERRITETAARVDETHRVLSGKRVLAILDGVQREEDDIKIAPLLQALSDCSVVVTSRISQLPSLKATTAIDLERMNEDEAWSLFLRILGADRLENQRALVAAMGQVVDFHPLALDLAATLLREHHRMKLETLLESLRSERERLEATGWGLGSLRGMQSSMNVSYGSLTEDDKRFFAAMGAFAGNDFDAEAAAFVAETTSDAAAERLEQLSRRSFVQNRHRPGRYNLHPGFRGFAQDKLEDPLAELRMATYYCGLAKAHGRKLLGSEIHSSHTILTTELSNIFASHNLAAKRNDRVSWEICRDFIHGAMAYYFNLHALWSDWISWCQIGIEACQKLGDERSAISIAGSLGIVYQRKGDWDQAIEFYRSALAMMEKFGNTQGMATIYMNLGNIQTQKEDWVQANTSLRKSLQLREQLGDAHGMAQARANLGLLFAKHGERTKARALWTQAMEIFESLGSKNEADIVRKWLRKLPPESRK